jgi:hypothetical protein
MDDSHTLGCIIVLMVSLILCISDESGFQNTQFCLRVPGGKGLELWRSGWVKNTHHDPKT